MSAETGTGEPTAGEATGDVQELLERFGVIRVGEVRLGVQGRSCAGLIDLFRTTALPRSPAWVLGVLYLRGRIVPLLDTGRLLGIERRGPYAAGLVVSSGRSTGVLAVDEMVAFEPYDVRGVSAVNGSTSPRLKSLSEGVLIAGGAPVVVLEVDSLFRAARIHST